MKQALLLAAAALTVLCAPTPASAQDRPAAAMEDSVARLKDALKQEHAQQRGNAVSAALEGLRQAPVEEQSTGGKMLKGLGLCVGVFLIGVALCQRLRARATAAGGGRMRVIERLPLSAKTSLILVECEGRTLLAAVGPERVTLHERAAQAVEQFELECGAEETEQDRVPV